MWTTSATVATTKHRRSRRRNVSIVDLASHSRESTSVGSTRAGGPFAACSGAASGASRFCCSSSRLRSSSKRRPRAIFPLLFSDAVPFFARACCRASVLRAAERAASRSGPRMQGPSRFFFFFLPPRRRNESDEESGGNEWTTRRTTSSRKSSIARSPASTSGTGCMTGRSRTRCARSTTPASASAGPSGSTGRPAAPLDGRYIPPAEAHGGQMAPEAGTTRTTRRTSGYHLFRPQADGPTEAQGGQMPPEAIGPGRPPTTCSTRQSPVTWHASRAGRIGARGSSYRAGM